MADSTFFTSTAPHTIKALADIGGCHIDASIDASTLIEDVQSLEHAGEKDITFLSNAKYKDLLKNSKASACILHKKHASYAPKNMFLLLSDNPYASYAKIAATFYPEPSFKAHISKKATIHKSAKIGKYCTIEAGVVIGKNAHIGHHCVIKANTVIEDHVTVGDHCTIHANTTISHSHIGHHVTIHRGACIGQDGFGFATENGSHISVPQLGRVIIGNHVNIGANCCIDRGAGPDTIIGDGCRLDNLVQIGHNVRLGKGCVVVSQVGISGSTKCGDYVVIGGQAGIAGHLEIGSLANIAAQSGVMQNISPKEIVGGSPAVGIKQWHRQTIALRKLTSSTQGNTDE